MRKHPKRIRKLLREWASVAHERELNRELARLDEHFAAWRRGELGSGELASRVHKFDVGPVRKLYNRYSQNDDDINVAYAIVCDVLHEGEIPSELLEAIVRMLSFFRDRKERNELRYPDER